MTYTPTWTQANGQGLLDSSFFIRRCDLREIADVVNRRRLLTFQDPVDYLSLLPQGQFISQKTMDDEIGQTSCLRAAIIDDVLCAPPGQSGLTPPNPQTIQWLWPLGDADEDKPITNITPAPAGHVSIFEKLNEGSTWTDTPLALGSPARASHVDEMRQALTFLRRGRWQMPVFLNVGIFSPMPNMPWFGGSVANNGSVELRTLGRVFTAIDDRGLHDVTVRSASMEITASAACRVQLLQCLRPLDYAADPPTWNRYRPIANLSWSTPGGMGNGDSVSIATATITPPTPAVVATQSLTAMVQSAIDGGVLSFTIRRDDTGPQTIDVTATLTVDFDLN